MTRTEIQKMAIDAHLFDDDQEPYIEHLEQFAALVTQAERESRQAAQAENEQLKARLARSGVELRAAVRAEREACHALRQTLPNPMAHCQTSAHAYDMAIVDYGKAIRARNHIVDANKMDCTDCDCADNEPCKLTAPGLALESGEFVPAEKISEKLKCWCTTCRPITPFDARFVVCPECGNKRCPKAHNHELTCTNSNDVGQKGSSCEHVKPFAQNNDPEDKTDWAAA